MLFGSERNPYPTQILYCPMIMESVCVRLPRCIGDKLCKSRTIPQVLLLRGSEKRGVMRRDCSLSLGTDT